MDRLSALALTAALGLVACGGGDQKGKKPTRAGRVDAVKAAPKQAVDLDEFCEVRKGPAEARTFKLPELAEGSGPSGSSWHWINVWATWCKPCIEELPLLAKWRERFSKDGLGLELVFLSVDAEADVVREFRGDHPELPDSLRIRDHEQLGTWLQSLGLDESSVLPIHLFVDPEQRLRCVRMGGVGESEYDAIKQLVAS